MNLLNVGLTISLGDVGKHWLSLGFFSNRSYV